MLNANAVPQDPNFGGGQCEDNPAVLVVTCCWYESDEEGIEIRYCQHCDIDIKTGDVTNKCGEKHPIGFMPPASNDNIIRNDGEMIDDTKEPLPPFISGRDSVIGNLADQDLQQTPSFNQKNPSSIQDEPLANSDNLDKTFTPQENDNSGNSKDSSNSNDNEIIEDNPPQ